MPPALFDYILANVEEHSGHQVKSLRDGFMVAFASVRRAVEEQNRRQPPDQQVRVRVGLNTAEVMQPAGEAESLRWGFQRA